MKTKLLLAGLCMCSLTFGSQADAYLYNDWGNVPAYEETLNEGDILDSRDISSAQHATDGNFHYFRMDLFAAPTPSNTGSENNYAGTYGIYIDTVSDFGGNGAIENYVPSSLQNIDVIVDSHYNHYFEPTAGWFKQDFHYWDETSNSYLLGTAPLFEANGNVLEWKISVADIGTNFIWHAATHDFGSVVKTYDMLSSLAATPAPVPVPAAIWLLGSGLLGLVPFRKR